MLLIGQYDSPFVRRVAIALNLYGLPFEQVPWSTFADADRLATYNPLRRVPTLVFDEDEPAIIESSIILDHLDQMAGPHRQLVPTQGSERRSALRACALATGLCEKMVSLTYERMLHAETSRIWIDRCETQIRAVLDVLDQDCARLTAQFWFGTRPGHADVAVACAMRFLAEVHGEIYDDGRSWPYLNSHAQRCEALPEFASVVQAFVAPV